MTEEKQKKGYDVLAHVPQQIENLLQARAQANPELFNHILSGLYQTLKDEKMFVDGVDQDQSTLQEDFGKTFTMLRNTAKTALDSESDVEMVNYLKQATNTFDNEYSTVQQQFMDNVLETCMTFVRQL